MCTSSGRAGRSSVAERCEVQSAADSTPQCECNSNAAPSLDVREQCTTPVEASSLAVPHILQQTAWDCGLACVAMALQAGAAGAHQPTEHSLASLRTRCPTSNIWTIHLGYLLLECGADVIFCTVTLGARSDYLSHRYYAATTPADIRRINQLFQEAPAAGLAVRQCSVPIERLQALMLEGRWLAIVLVDRMLIGHAAPASGPAAAGGTAGPNEHLPEVEYVGHYLILCGYDRRTDAFEARDPATQTGAQLRLPSAELEAARRAFGTDEDLLLLAVPNRGTLGASAM